MPSFTTPNCFSIVTARSSWKNVTEWPSTTYFFSPPSSVALTSPRTQPLVRVHPCAEVIDHPDIMSQT